jgi:hypothetical protein
MRGLKIRAKQGKIIEVTDIWGRTDSGKLLRAANGTKSGFTIRLNEFQEILSSSKITR